MNTLYAAVYTLLANTFPCGAEAKRLNVEDRAPPFSFIVHSLENTLTVSYRGRLSRRFLY